MRYSPTSNPSETFLGLFVSARMMNGHLDFTRSEAIPIQPRSVPVVNSDIFFGEIFPHHTRNNEETLDNDDMDFFALSSSAPAFSTIKRETSDHTDFSLHSFSPGGSVDDDVRKARHRNVERNRRQRINYCYDAIKELCNCSKKDKASILQSAIDTIKNLQSRTTHGVGLYERVTALEEENRRLREMLGGHEPTRNEGEFPSLCSRCSGIPNTSLVFGGIVEKLAVPMALLKTDGEFILRNPSLDRLLLCGRDTRSLFDVTAESYRSMTFKAIRALLDGTVSQDILELETLLIRGPNSSPGQSAIRTRLTLSLVRDPSSAFGLSVLFVPLEFLSDQNVIYEDLDME